MARPNQVLLFLLADCEQQGRVALLPSGRPLLSRAAQPFPGQGQVTEYKAKLAQLNFFVSLQGKQLPPSQRGHSWGSAPSSLAWHVALPLAVCDRRPQMALPARPA